MRQLIALVSAALLLSGARAQSIDDFDVYRYRLEINENPKLCRHMDRVYNQNFSRPWDFRDRPMLDVFPRLENVERNDLLENRLRYSAYPSSPEFDAIA